jgi:hypothetical protein
MVHELYLSRSDEALLEKLICVSEMYGRHQSQMERSIRCANTFLLTIVRLVSPKRAGEDCRGCRSFHFGFQLHQEANLGFHLVSSKIHHIASCVDYQSLIWQNCYVDIPCRKKHRSDNWIWQPVVHRGCWHDVDQTDPLVVNIDRQIRHNIV